MKKLIEYKLWDGSIPYFVDAVLGGIYNNGKCYGLSKDTTNCYLPDTVRVLTKSELLQIVLLNDIIKSADENTTGETILLTNAEKETFLNSWLASYNVSVSEEPTE